MNCVIENDIPKAISKEEIIVSTANDRELQKLIKCVEDKSLDHKDADLRKYSNVFNELAVVDGLVVRGGRIVMPQTLREAMVKIAHEGYQGIVRTKQLLHAHVWFPGMDAMVEKHVGRCLACQSTTPCHTKEPLQMTDLPRGPWKKVSVNFAGPLRNKDMGFLSFGTSMPGIQSLSLHQALLLITSFSYLRACSTRTESPKRSNRIMGPRLMDQSLRTLLRNKGSDT